MENQAMQAEERLKVIIKHAPTGLAEIDQNGTIIQLNLKGEALLKPVISSINFDDNNFFPVLSHMAPGIVEKIKNYPNQCGNLATNEVHHFTVSIAGENIDKYFQFTVTRLFTHCITIAFNDVTDNSKNEKTMLQLVLDKAVEQDKFNFSANVLHDIGNAVVGFGSYVNRIKRSVEENNPENLLNLAGFFEAQQTAMAVGIGEAKAGAVLTMLNTIAATQKANHDEIKNLLPSN